MENLQNEIQQRLRLIRAASEALQAALQKPVPKQPIDPLDRLESLLSRPDRRADPVTRAQALLDQNRDEADRAIRSKMLEDSIAQTQQEVEALQTRLQAEQKTIAEDFAHLQELAQKLQKAQIATLKAAIALKKHGEELNERAMQADGIDRFRDLSDRNSRIFWPIILDGKILFRCPTLREVDELRDIAPDLI